MFNKFKSVPHLLRRIWVNYRGWVSHLLLYLVHSVTTTTSRREWVIGSRRDWLSIWTIYWRMVVDSIRCKWNSRWLPCSYKTSSVWDCFKRRRRSTWIYRMRWWRWRKISVRSSCWCRMSCSSHTTKIRRSGWVSMAIWRSNTYNNQSRLPTRGSRSRNTSSICRRWNGRILYHFNVNWETWQWDQLSRMWIWLSCRGSMNLWVRSTNKSRRVLFRSRMITLRRRGVCWRRSTTS